MPAWLMLGSIIDKLQHFETKNLWFIKFWILDQLFMEHPVTIIKSYTDP